MGVEYVTYCEAICEVIWSRDMISWSKVVKSISKTLILCYDNATVVNFFQMMKVLPVQNILILSINLLEKRYATIVYVVIDLMLANPLTRYKQVTRINLTKHFSVLD